MDRIKILYRKKLGMSAGKLAAQSVHAALSLAGRVDLHPLMSVVVLGVNETPFQNAKVDNNPVAVVRDAGYTEVEPGTETCVAFLEMNASWGGSALHARDGLTSQVQSLEQRLAEAIKALVQWKCMRCLDMNEWLKQGCPVCKGTSLNSIASNALSKITGGE